MTQPAEKPESKLKPEQVDIIAFELYPMRTEIGKQEVILIVGLGNDNIMYSYNAQNKEWYDRV